jgi:membrane protein YqaA with SNARE-associated domain
MKESTTRLYNWAIEKAASTRAPLWLGLLFSLELILLIPLDAILMFFCLQRRSNILLYIMIATIASAISGALGYLVGHFLWDLIGNWVIPHVLSLATFERLSSHLQLYENWAVFFGSLFPLPLKALSLTAGVFKLGLTSFITWMVAGRLIRFSLIGIAMALWGEKVKLFVDRHFHRIFLVLGAKIAMGIVFFWVLAR